MSKTRFFGTDGIRGKVGQGHITPSFMMLLGWVSGRVLCAGQAKTVVLAQDGRASGDMLLAALKSGLMSAGLDVIDLGVLPTPGLACLTHSLRADFGIMVSASHNLAGDNGVKFFNESGKKLSDHDVALIETTLASSTAITSVSAEQIGRSRSVQDAATRYAEFCKSTFPTVLSLDGLTVVVDCANGACSTVAPRVFAELGACVIPIHASPNGSNINAGCGSTQTAALVAAVQQHQASLGVAFDGDGDRLIMVDHTGEVVDGDEILAILALDRSTGMAAHAGVVGTMMSNLGLEHAVLASGIAFERTAVGDRFVLERLQEKGWTLGGESSGHIVDLDHTTTGDGIIAALQVMRIMQSSSSSLQSLKHVMVKLPQVLVNVPCHSAFDCDQHQGLQSDVSSAMAEMGQQGRILIRASGTEPLIRVMVEGANIKQVENIAHHIAGRIAHYLETAITTR